MSNLFDPRAKLVGARQLSAERDRDVEGVEGGTEWGGGVPLPSRLEGLGERRKLPLLGLRKRV